jgi:diguanylate cyclase (GGDEF)-like protein/PAS domain S-box-containing protein
MPSPLSLSERFPASLRIALLYLALANVWIWTSDWLVLQLFQGGSALVAAQSWKGTLFVVFTAGLVYLLVRREEGIQQRYQQALVESNRRWQFAVDGSELGLWDWDVSQGRVYFSRCWKSMLGYGPDDVADDLNEWESRVHPDDLAQCYQDIQAHMAGRTDHYSNEHRMRCKDGSYKWILDRGQVVERDVHGQPLRMIGTHTDLTELKQREAALALNADVFMHSAEAVTICDAQSRIVSVNRAFTEITGYAAEEVLGQNPSLLQSGRHDRDFYRDMWHQIHTEGRWQGELWNRRKDGTVYPEWLSINRACNAQGEVTHYYAIFSDLSARKRTEAQIQHMAHHDALTDLPNRQLLRDRIESAVATAARNRESFAVMFVDLDRFKNINDSMGHSQGDRLLVELAGRLRAAVRRQDTVSRPGGDEFNLLLPRTDADGAAHLAQQVVVAVSRPYLIDGRELTVTPSIGIAMFPNDGTDVETLLQSCDAAMYLAKKAGGNGFRFFAPDMHRHASRMLQVENALRRALERDELTVHYQPQVDLHTGAVVGCEALTRWNHEELGQVSPAEFIPVAEESGLILPLGAWVLRTSAAQAVAWQRQGLPALVMAVNVSALQFRQTQFPEQVAQVLREAGLSAQWLELELTESVMAENPEQAITTMGQLHGLGVRLSIDDFGTGYSSLAYLKRFQVDKLKIDQSFVRDLHTDANSASIATAVIAMAHSLGLSTIAEGIETQEQHHWLAQQGCSQGQGYRFTPALPPEALVQWLQDRLKTSGRA